MKASLQDFMQRDFALAFGGESFSLGAIAARARALPWAAEAAGRVVLASARTPLDALVHFEACLNAGAVFLPDTRASSSSALGHDFVPRVGECLALRTSGSTGAPRHAAFALEAVARSARRVAHSLQLTDEDVVGLMLPCDHGFGFIAQLLAAGSVGARVVWASAAFPGQRVDALAAARASVVALVPFGLAQLLPVLAEQGPRPLPSLRQVGVAGGALSPALAAATRACLPDLELHHHYGCTEAGPRLTTLSSADPAFVTGSVGRALEGVRLRVLRPDPEGAGELVFQSDMAMTRYLEGDACTESARVATPEGPALRTGDIGRVAADGLVFITGRVDDVVKLRGEKVSLAAVARAAEDVGALAAFAHHARRCGSEPDGGIVVVYEGEVELTPRHFVTALPKGVVPKKLLRVAALPRTPSGKIDRVAAAGLAASHAGGTT